jgi:hypothetical protein
MKIMLFGKIKDAFNRLKKNRLLYTFLTTALAFNLLIVASFAWLTLNRKTAVEDMGMGLAVNNTSAVYEAYMYDLSKGAGTDLNADGEKLNVTNIDLNQYDTIFRGQNKYTPVFAKIVLLRSDAMPKSGTVYITIDRQSGTTDEGVLSEFTSSIVRFTGFIIPNKADLEVGKDLSTEEYAEKYPEELYSFISTQERFETVEEYTGHHAHSKTFVNVIHDEENGTHSHTKNNSLTIEVPYSETDWYKNADNNDTMHVYLYITYDPTLVQCYMDEHTDGELSLESNLIFFDNDMKEVKVSYAK